MKKFFIVFSAFLLSYNISFSQTWTQKLNGRSVWSLTHDNSGNVYAGGLTSNNSRIWKSSDGGDSWDTIHFGSGQTMWDFGFDSQGTMYVANYSTGLLKSTNAGATFTLIPSSVFSFKNLQGVACGNNGYIYITTSTGFLRSTDNGATFNETALSGLNCLPLLVDIDSSNIVYVGVTGSSGIGFYRSTNYGLTFGPNLNPGKNGFNLLQRPNGEIHMITTTSPYNFDRSTNKGLTWTVISNTAASPRGIAYSVTGNFYTAGNGGVFRSTDNGLSFNNYNFTLTATPALAMNYNSTVRIYTGVSGAANGGVWMCTEGPAPVIKVNLTVLTEGLYFSGPNILNRKDLFRLYLRNTSPPYRISDSASAFIDTVNFNGLFTFYESPSGSYYLVAKHMNSIETWSKAGGEVLTGDGSIYNFNMTSASAQAYGSNLKLKGSKYCMYGADPNQDGIVDGSDGALIDNDASNFVSGYVVTDLNGDYIVDGSDYVIADNNASVFVGLIRP